MMRLSALLCLVAAAQAFSPAALNPSAAQLLKPSTSQLLRPSAPQPRTMSSRLCAPRGFNLKMQESDAQGALQEQQAVVIAREGVSYGPPQQEQQQQQQYYTEQPAPMGEMQLPKQGYNKMMIGAGAVALAAGGYFGVKNYKIRQERLVNEFAYSMMLYWGDDELSKETVKEYKGRVGPIINTFHKGDMWKEYTKKLASDKPLSITSLNDFRQSTQLLGISKGAAAKILAKCAEELVPYTKPTELWERNANKPSVLGKLLWLTERCYPDPMAISKMRERFPESYGDEVIDVLQNTLTEEAYKDIINAGGGAEAGLQPGFMELGLSQDGAQQILDNMLEEIRIAAEEAARIQAEKDEEERILAIKEAAWKANQGKTNMNDGKVKTHGEDPNAAEKKRKEEEAMRGPQTHEYECTICGYTLFVAAGREFKFFGDGYKCPQCGAEKKFFKDNAVEA